MLTSVQQSRCHSGAHFQEGVIHLFGVSVIHVHPGFVTAGREMGLGKIFPRCDLNTPVVTAAYKEKSLPGLWVIWGRHPFPLLWVDQSWVWI